MKKILKKKTNSHNHSHNHVNFDLDNSFNNLENFNCGHNLKQINCNECRGELGVVKLNNLSINLVKSYKLKKQKFGKNFEFTGRIISNPLKTVFVCPVLQGRIIKVSKTIGDNVKKGDMLALLHSGDYKKRKLEYISSSINYKIAEQKYEWINNVHKNLDILINEMKKSVFEINLENILKNLEIGENKGKLSNVFSKYRLAKSNYKIDMKIISNIENLLKKIKPTENLSLIDEALEFNNIGEWKGKILIAASKLKFAKDNYIREKNLMKSQLTAEKELQEIEVNYLNAAADYQSLVETVYIWIDKKKLEIKSEVDIAFAEYLSVLEEIKIDLKLHKLEVQKEYEEALNNKIISEKNLIVLGLTEKEIKNIIEKKDSEFLEVRAPIDGTIVSFNVSEGQFVDISEPLFKISNLDIVWAWCDIYENNIPDLQLEFNKNKSLCAKVMVNRYPVFDGKLDYISNFIDEESRTLKIKIVLNNDKNLLKPGMFINAIISIPIEKKSILMPKKSVFKDEGNYFVFKKLKEDYWIRKNVKISEEEIYQENNNYLQILSGLKEDEEVIIDGGFMMKSEVLKHKIGAG